MSDKPKLVKLRQAIEDAGGVEAMLDRIADGDALLAIAQSFGFSSRTPLYQWRDLTPENKEGWESAMKERATTHMDKALYYLDECAQLPNPTSAQVSLANYRANHHVLQGKLLDRERYGDKPATTTVTYNIGLEHLQALRASSPVPALTGKEVILLPVPAVEP